MRFSLTTPFVLVALLSLGACGPSSGSESATPPQSPASVDPVSQPAESLPNGSVAGAEPGTIVLDLHGDTEVGSGVVFVSGESLLIRGLVGTADKHFELNIGGAREGDQPVPADTTISAVVGGDAVDPNESFVVLDAPSNTLTVVRDPASGRVSGSFEFLAVPEVSRDAGGGQIPVKGNFDLEAADSADWECDFGPTNITNCRFVDG